MFSTLILLSVLEPGSDSVLARTRQVAARYADTAAPEPRDSYPSKLAGWSI